MISVVIMGHPARKHLIRKLRRTLSCEVVLDERNDLWDTGRRSLLAYDPRASHHLVVQDDAILCRDFLPGVQRVLEHVPQVPVSLYTGSVQPWRQATATAVNTATRQGRPFIAMRGPLWGVAIAFPVLLIEELVADCDRRRPPKYDTPLSEYFAARRVECWYTIPSLVNHRVGPENPSLVFGHGNGPGRVAHQWIGRRSPLGIDWSGGAYQVTTGPLAIVPRRVQVPSAQRRRSRMAVKRIATQRLYGVDRHGRQVLVAAPGQPIPPGFTEEPEQEAPADVPAAAPKKPRAKRKARAKGR